jgi:hypothetical protein
VCGPVRDVNHRPIVRNLLAAPDTDSRDQAEMSSEPTVHAPDFQQGLDWINTGGRALKLADLRGKIVILDFWTYG